MILPPRAWLRTSNEGKNLLRRVNKFLASFLRLQRTNEALSKKPKKKRNH
jgi:hypothetical protein